MSLTLLALLLPRLLFLDKTPDDFEAEERVKRLSSRLHPALDWMWVRNIIGSKPTAVALRPSFHNNNVNPETKPDYSRQPRGREADLHQAAGLHGLEGRIERKNVFAIPVTVVTLRENRNNYMITGYASRLPANLSAWLSWRRVAISGSVIISWHEVTVENISAPKLLVTLRV